jgi:AraC-like DNA-binding protein
MIRGRSRPHPLKWVILWASAWRSEEVTQAVEAFKFAAEGKAVQEQGSQFLLWPEDWGRAADTGVPAEVEDAFMSCHTIQDVAARLGSSTSTVRQWLNDCPRFGRAWLEMVRERRMQQARANLLQAMGANVEISRSALMQACSTDVEWLSRNAPLTLRSILNRLPARKGPQNELF